MHNPSDMNPSLADFVSSSTTWPPRLVSPLSAWNEHIPFAGWVVEATEPRTVVELGTHSGVSYFAFCEAVLRLGLLTECFAVDHWLGDEHSGHYGEDVFRSVNQLNNEFYGGFSRLLRQSFDEAVAEFADGSVDLLHIDGFHTYEAVRHDFDAWFPKMSERGIVLLHDTSERKGDFGVFRLMAELRNEFPCFEFTHGHGLGVVAVGPSVPSRIRALVGLDDTTLVRLIRTTYQELGARFALTVERDQLPETSQSVEQERDQLQRDVTVLTKQLASNERSTDEYRLVVEDERRARTAAEAELEKRSSDLVSLRRQLEDANKLYRQLLTRRSVRFALRLARMAAPAIRYMRRIRSGKKQNLAGGSKGDSPGGGSANGAAARWRAPSQRDQARLEKQIARQRPGSERTDGPLVSIVILTRNGAEHLKRVLSKLDTGTRYKSLEVIVVDNNSTDETAEVLQIPRSFPLSVIRNERNVSFSEGNNHAARSANGELLLFLNNDIEPVNAGWLGAMVDSVRGREGTVAGGAELVYPVLGVPATDLTVQHAGISFAFYEGAVHPFNGRAKDPLDKSLEGIRVVPAATADALLVDAGAFWSVGGFDEGYICGTEDVDLCLKLGQLGQVVVTGQAVLFHHESATQSYLAAEITRVNRLRNYQRFAERWGPRLSRTVAEERFSGNTRYRPAGKRKVAITLTHDEESRGWGDYYTAHGLGDAFADQGWEVFYAERYLDHWYELGDDMDLVISLLDTYDARNAPAGAFTVAWVRNWVDRWLDQPWFDAYDMVVTSSHKASGLIAERSRFLPPVIGMAADPDLFQPGPVNPTFRSDYVFTGNNRGASRSIVDILDIHPGEDFLIFGKGWEKDPRMQRYWRGHLEHKLLPEVYRSANIVVDDTAAPNLPYGFLNGRVFDALAAGTLVITDNTEGSSEFFEGLLPTYSNGEELRAQLDRFLGDHVEREKLAGELRRRVVESHSYQLRPQAFLDAAIEHISRPRAAIKIAVPNEEVSKTWGDTHFADGLASALTAAGMPTKVHLLPEWDLPASQAVDVVIHIRGLVSYVPKPTHVNIMWIISHPDDVTVPECEKYDLVLVASSSHAEWLDAQTEVPVVFMPQATDHRRFRPVAKVPALESDVLFLGNSRGQLREAVDWAIKQRLPLTVYGSSWEGRIPAEFVAAEHFPNRDLATLYASAKVVLNDHWPDMRDRGFVSNRIFDALASGAAVVSDSSPGLKDLFDDIVPTFSSPEELTAVVNRVMDDPEERESKARRGAELVLSEHTFQRRAEVIIDLLQPMISGRQKNMDGETFGRLTVRG